MLQAALGEAYELEKELPGGGMSRVFVASELALGRKVVVKVLAPDLSEGISLERFEREIRVLASMQQANIVPLLSAGRIGGLPYYMMPFVEGRSLRDLLVRDGALPIGRGIDILRDVARALDFAHAHGVVHRDIKPDNVLLSGDTAVVTDFGISKALTVARGEEGERLTRTGSGIGTPAYMPPEQAAGDPNVDHRADIYSFGCLAYEIFAGTPPFHGGPAHQVVAAHFQQTPSNVTARRPDVPAAISALIARCLEKDPARRPQSARELIAALDPSHAAGRARRPSSRAVLLLGAVSALAMASAVYFVYRRSSPREPPVVTISLAVLPFINVGGDSTEEYLADGIRDEVATALGRVTGVRIIGRSAAFRYRNRRDLDVREVGRTLGARYLLQGKLRQSGNRLNVSAQLSDSASGAELWADLFERNPQDLGHIRDDIVRAVSDTLRSRLGAGAAVTKSRGTGTVNPDAYDLYLRGEHLLQSRGRGVERSVDNFERAIAVDPRFARAYAGLGAALVLYPYFTGASPMEIIGRATSAAHRALDLDSSLAEPHTTLGVAYWQVGRPRDAEPEFRRAILLEPENLDAHLQYGRLLISTGRENAAITELTRAGTIDPLSPVASVWLAYAIFLSGDRRSALEQVERAWQIDSTVLPVLNHTMSINSAMGRTERARHVLNAAPTGVVMSYAPFVHARLGDSAVAMSLLRDMERHRPTLWFAEAERAAVMLALRDTARALSALEASASRSPGGWTLFLPPGDPLYDPIRGSARFAALLRAAQTDPKDLRSPRVEK